MQAERVHIDHEEDGFHLLVKTEEGEWFNFHIQDNAESLYDQCRSRIGPWLRERDEARGRYAVRWEIETVDESGYSTSDPKHPDFHSVHANRY